MLPKELVDSLNRDRLLCPRESNDTTIRELHSKLDAADVVLSDMSFADAAAAKESPVSSLISKMQQLLSQQSINTLLQTPPLDYHSKLSAARALGSKPLNVNINVKLTAELRADSRSPIKEKYSLPKPALKANQQQATHKKFDSLKLIADLKEKFKKKAAPDTTGLTIDKRSRVEEAKKKSLGQLQKNVSKPKELTGTWTSRNTCGSCWASPWWSPSSSSCSVVLQHW